MGVDSAVGEAGLMIVLSTLTLDEGKFPSSFWVEVWAWVELRDGDEFASGSRRDCSASLRRLRFARGLRIMARMTTTPSRTCLLLIDSKKKGGVRVC